MSDKTDIAPTDGAGRAIATTNSASMLAMIAGAASDPTVDAGKMVTLAKLATDLQDRERQADFSAAKVAAVAAMPAIFKQGKSDKHRYAKWEDMHRRIMPILSRHGLTLTHAIGQSGNMITVEAVLEHSNGVQLRGGPLPLPIDNSGSKNPVQGVASTVAYGKRITGKAILNIIESDFQEDDDGESGGEGRTLNPVQQALVDAADRAAGEGPVAYLEWFKAQDSASRGWLVVEGVHEKMKAKAQSL